ncbi:MAG: hypothetical protein GY793_04290 [Proteobacteria bacterium]|nr:hypothetical protein [Pseudomonadota bacterium]
MKSFEEVKKELLKKTNKSKWKMDPGILDLVVVLTCLGFETISSCEGHPEKTPTFFPHVTIMTKKEEKDKVQDCWHRNLIMQKNMIALLQDFYLDRDTEYQHRFIADMISGGGTELRPHSGYLTKILDDEKERNNLHKIYTKEVQDFTIFLKKQF